MNFTNIKQLYPLITSCLRFLDKREKYKAIFIAYLLLFSSVLEMVALVSILPFITFLISPEIIYQKSFFKYIEFIIVDLTEYELVFIFAFSAIFLLVLSLFLSFIIQHQVRKFVVKCQNRLAKEVINKTIVAPYPWFLSQNTTSKSHFLQTDILMWANDGLLRIMSMIGSITLLIAASLTLIFISTKTAIFSILSVLIFSIMIVNSTRNKISKFSEIRRTSNTSSLTSLNQIFKGIKDIRVSSTEQFFKNRFIKYFSDYGYSGTNLRFFQNISPVIIMAIGQASIIIIALTLWLANYSAAEIASIMALIILVISRIVPNINKLVNDLNGIWAALPHIKSLENHFNLRFIKNKVEKNDNNKLILEKWNKIELKNISFKYPDSKKEVLNNLNFKFVKGKSYAIVGVSGTGKSTFIDLIIGLLEPKTGTIKIDNNNLHDINYKHWTKQIGYIPQDPFIADDTLRNNVAFGLTDDLINDSYIYECLSMAQLKDFFVNNKSGLNTRIGDAGSKVSGGQKQRIAIARALYNNPSLLILDEATSAVDNVNVKAFKNVLSGLYGKITTIIIAHNMSTIQNCDEIIVMDKGTINTKGTFEYLTKNSNFFRELSENT